MLTLKFYWIKLNVMSNYNSGSDIGFDIKLVTNEIIDIKLVKAKK